MTRAAGLDVGVQERGETDRAGVGDDAEPGPTEADFVELDSAREQHLPECSAARHARLGAAQERLIDLHVATQPVPARPHHHRPVAVQHHPRRLVGAQLHLSPHLGRRDPDLVPNHPPSRSEPHRQRRPGLVEDRARRRGHLAVATAALPPRVCQPPPDDARTVGADKPLRPAQPVQIVQALPVLVERRPQLRVRPRIVPASRMLHDHLSRVPKWRPPFVPSVARAGRGSSRPWPHCPGPRT